MGDAHVVIQSLWRSCGTYFWSKLRQNITNRAYYEPFHEELLTLAPDKWEANFRGGVTALLRHPRLDRHYAAEFPLRVDGGLKHFDASLCYDRFFLTAQDECKEIETYLNHLISYAQMFGQRACYKFVRGGTRAGFLRRVLGGHHVFVNRPPSEIVGSFASFGDSNYFLGSLVFILARNPAEPFVVATREALQALGGFDDRPLRALSVEGLQSARMIAGSLNAAQISLLATAFWLAYALEAAAAADLILDTERLTVDPAYRDALAPQLSRWFGPSVIADFRAPPRKAGAVASVADLKAIVRNCPRLSQLGHSLDSRRLEAFGAESRATLESVI